MLPGRKSTFTTSVVAGLILTAGCATRVVVAQPPPPPPPPAQHPAYLHALSDLRAARWLIEHRPGNAAETADEVEAVRQIDAAIGDIKKAAYDDGKNANDRPPVDAHPEMRGNMHEALQYLGKARSDIAREEDNGYAGGLRNRAIGHIDAATNSARNVFHE